MQLYLGSNRSSFSWRPTVFDSLPAFAICGWSGSGKTTLIEKLIRRLRSKGLKVAVVKHDAHGIDIDRPGKDSDRFFQAGADVLLQGPQQEFLRIHRSGTNDLYLTLSRLAQQYDLILVEGHKGTALPKIWLLAEGEHVPPDQVGNLLEVLTRDADRLETAADILDKWLPKQWRKTPVFGCILIGGASSRMGRAKHLLLNRDRTWIENTTELLQQVCREVVIVGAGEVPDRLSTFPRLSDVPQASGPMAGLLAAMRWNPQASWLLAACDLPATTPNAIHWLLATRAPGVWATLPRLSGSVGVEPLFAHYDFRSRRLVERLVANNEFSLAGLADRPKVSTPTPPSQLVASWQNINTPADLHAFGQAGSQFKYTSSND